MLGDLMFVRRVACLLFPLVGLLGVTPAQAVPIPIIYNMGHTRIEKVTALPDEPEFMSPVGHLDLGWAYKDYSVYGMPLGFGDAEGLVLYRDDQYYALPADARGKLTQKLGHDYSTEYHLNPLAHLWGWLVLGLVIAYGAWRQRRSQPAAARAYDNANQGIDPDVEARVINALKSAASSAPPPPAADPPARLGPAGFGKRTQPPGT